MRPEPAIVKDLQAIDPNFFVVWDPHIERWQVREWVTESRVNRDAYHKDLWLRKSILVTTVCIRDDQFHDIGYKPLDQRTVSSVRKSQRTAEDPDILQKEVDDHNERMLEQTDRELELAGREMGRDIWRHYREPTIDLGQKGAR